MEIREKAGDLGCSMGPTLVGRVSALAGDNLKTGILAAVVLPVMLLIALALNRGQTMAQTGSGTENVIK